MATPHPHPHPHYDHLQLSLSSTLLLLLLIFSLASATIAAAAITIQDACKATRYPSACESSLLHQSQKLPNPASASLIINSALSLSSRHLQTAQSMANSILQNFPNHRNRSMAARTCLDLFSMSAFRLKMASSSSLSSRAWLKDARAWTGAALTYQYDCWSELSYVNGTRLVDQTMSFLDGTLMPSASNALSIMFSLDNFGKENAAKWGPPRTERDGFWERTQSGSGELRFLPNQGVRFGKVGATVCKEGKARGCDATVQQAVDASPEGLKGRDRFVIYIKAGVYDEIVRVPIEKTNLVFLGDGMGKTVITGSVNTGVLGISTYNTATVGVKGDGFIARGITFQNTAGPSAGHAAHQAVAFRSDSDFSLIENCEFLGNQDTLYAHSLRQVYRSCRIEGNVDFIFGNAAALFQDCTILVRPRELNPSKGENNAVTAHGRTDPAEPTGLVLIGCIINGTEEYMKLWQANPKVHKNYLGRPWKMYSRTVFIGSTMEKLISPEGWMPFRGDFALSTLYYGEFGNKGPGADLSKRVSWSSQIPQEHLNAYSAENFIQADEWISSL